LTGFETGEKGRAIGSMTADGKELRKFGYGEDGETSYIDQFEVTSPGALPTDWPSTGIGDLQAECFLTLRVMRLAALVRILRV
jgi:hypothetical protein